MHKNNLIRFAQSFLFLPFLVGTVSLGGVVRGVEETAGAVLSEKENIEISGSGFLAFNREMDRRAREAESLVLQAELIDGYFRSRSMPLAGFGAQMAQEARENGLDWRLLPAIAVRESTGGKFQCQKVKNNPFGWGSCKIGFSSYEEAIETVARNLSGKNPNTSHFYAGKDTSGILRAYNPPSVVPRYAEQVMRIMEAMGEKDIHELQDKFL